MCFVIDYDAEVWTERYVYKSVREIRKEAWMSEWFDFEYELGKTYELDKDAEILTPGDTASEGFYVYKTKEFAFKNVEDGYGYKVICLEVKKEDFIFSNGIGIATYRRVRVVGEIV